MTIQKLADRSGVSRAMISRIERDESRPTTPVLNRLSTGLGVPLSTLLGDTSYRASRARERAPVATRPKQTTRMDPDRAVSPAHADAGEPPTRLGSLLPKPLPSLQLTDNLLSPGAQTVSRAMPGQRCGSSRSGCSRNHGSSIRRAVRHLKHGDCMAMMLDQPCTVQQYRRKGCALPDRRPAGQSDRRRDA